MGLKTIVCLALCLAYLSKTSAQITNRRFPESVKFGCATASYQVEGAWNEDGKGENIWDHAAHNTPDVILDRDNGDISCDSYHKYKEDVQLLKNLGVDFYRFSLSWSRLLPDGTINQVNPLGIEYYNNLIDELIANDIEPLVTIFHWDTPQPLEEKGGFINETIVDYFGDYARFVFEQFGGKVKRWLTFNEPKQTCQLGYGDGTKAPFIAESGVLDYICAHNLIKAHARAYHIYDEEFRPTQGGVVSIVIDTTWQEPASDSDLDIEAAERALQFIFGWYADPIYLRDYPPVMIDRIGERSALEGLSESRLPEFTPDEVDYISGTFDYLAANVYSTAYAAWAPDPPIGDISYYNDLSIVNSEDPAWPSSASVWLRVVPWGARKLLVWLKNRYNNPEIIITENGFTDLRDMNDLEAQLQDNGRIHYLRSYLSAILEAVLDDGVRLIGYTHWSLVDNLEWERGFTEKFGLHYVNFSDPERPRTPKASASYYKSVIETRCLLDECVD